MIDACRALYTCRKCPFIWPAPEDWNATGNLQALATTFRLEMPLATEDGISIEGMSLVLEFAALSPHPGAAVLRHCPRTAYHLGRYDFGTAERHTNTRAIAAGVCGIPKIVNGSHVHPFALNAKLGIDAFRATGNGPPAAVPIDDTRTSFRARMRLVGVEFSITDLEEIPPPPYQGDLWR